MNAWALLGVAVIGFLVLQSRRGQEVSGMKTSQSGIDAIKRHEGFRASAYNDAAGKLTIGYGHLITAGETFRTVTPERAEQILRADLDVAEASIRRLVRVPLTQGQFDALVSFVFNLGAGNLSTSTLLRKLNGGDYTGAAEEFPRWRLAAGKELPGLVVRRADERRRFEGLA